MPTPETSAFPTVRQWQRDCRETTQDQATPKCPNCGCHLGIRPAMFNESGTDEWECDNACCDNARDGNGQ
jgi:hypothetical protein